VVEEHSAGQAVAGSRHIAVAVVEEVADIRHIVVAVEDRRSFHTGVVEVHSSSRHILAEVGWSASVTVGGRCADRELLTDIAAEEGILRTAAAAAVGEALGRSLPGCDSLDPGSRTCLRNDVDFEIAMSRGDRMRS
jgi:hypothetical protein